jgi:hypothetical protein
MRQIRTMCIAVAIVAAVLALLSGAILMFLFEPPFMVSIFVACAAIAIICFAIAAIGVYFEE